MASQRFCLRWNNHQTNLLSVFDQLLHAETFTDVTLAVEGQYLKAHKMVLSACSPYFQALFINHPEKHPIVILKDVPYADMKCLLDFMYRGEVSVDQERLTAFLRVAESLRIKGLTEVNDDKPPQSGGNNNNSTNNNNSSNNNNNNSNNNVATASPPPQNNRNNQFINQHLQNKKQVQQTPPQGMLSANPLLGSALSQQKRKRGRPRKLSGSDMGDDYDDFEGENLVQGSPEMLEVKMGADAFSNSGDENVITRSENDHDDSMDTSDAHLNKSQSNQNPASSANKNPIMRNHENSMSDPTESQSLKSSIAPAASHSSPSQQNSSNIDKSDDKNLLVPKTEPVEPQSPQYQESFQQLQRQLQQQHLRNLQLQARSNIKIRVNPSIQQGSALQQLQTDSINNNSNKQQQNADSLQSPSSAPATPTSQSSASQYLPETPSGTRQPIRRRVRRKNLSPDDQAEALTEMSVRGLNLFRYARITDGVYQCTECAKDNVQKTFKNKYSFQRHAFLYHEGTQRKVFPCPVCNKEFSRPDKMKNHMKTTHECYMPKAEPTYPMNLLVAGEMPQQSQQSSQMAKIESVLTAFQMQQAAAQMKEQHLQQFEMQRQHQHQQQQQQQQHQQHQQLQIQIPPASITAKMESLPLSVLAPAISLTTTSTIMSPPE